MNENSETIKHYEQYILTYTTYNAMDVQVLQKNNKQPKQYRKQTKPEINSKQIQLKRSQLDKNIYKQEAQQRACRSLSASAAAAARRPPPAAAAATRNAMYYTCSVLTIPYIHLSIYLSICLSIPYIYLCYIYYEYDQIVFRPRRGRRRRLLPRLLARGIRYNYPAPIYHVIGIVCIHMCIHIYIYICVYTYNNYVYIYIYIYTHS